MFGESVVSKAGMIHPSAQIASDAELSEDVVVGPFSVIHSGVKIGARTRVGSHCVIGEGTQIGVDNLLHPFSSIGGASQSRGGSEEVGTRLEIGDRNVIHEYCTLNRGSLADGGVTRMGHDNLLMAYVHIAHDCCIGNQVVLVNHTTLGGHVQVHDGAVLGAFTAVRQFCRIGAYSFLTESAALSRDAMPYVCMRRIPPTVLGINRVGLRRHGFNEDQIAMISEAHRSVFRRNLSAKAACDWLRDHVEAHPYLTPMLDMLSSSKRGIVR